MDVVHNLQHTLIVAVAMRLRNKFLVKDERVIRQSDVLKTGYISMGIGELHGLTQDSLHLCVINLQASEILCSGMEQVHLFCDLHLLASCSIVA